MGKGYWVIPIYTKEPVKLRCSNWLASGWWILYPQPSFFIVHGFWGRVWQKSFFPKRITILLDIYRIPVLHMCELSYTEEYSLQYYHGDLQIAKGRENNLNIHW